MIWICMAGIIGYERAAELLQLQGSRQDVQFPKSFLRSFRSLQEHLLTEAGSEIGCSLEHVIYSGEILRGGLLGTLWQAMEAVADRGFPGCRVQADGIRIPQEIIEIMELYDENPYEVSSKGAWVLLIEGEEEQIFTWLQEAGSGLQVIGYLTRDHDRVIEGKEFRRFLTPPARQEKDLEAHRKQKAEV